MEQCGTFKSFAKKFDAGLIGAAFHGWRGQGNFERVAEFARDRIFPRTGMDFDRKRHSAIRLPDGNHEFRLNENAVSASNRAPTRVVCGCCSVRDLPMLAIRAITNTSMVTFAVMQDNLRPRTPRLRMRSTFNIAVNSKASPVPKIQILPV